jgi:5-hydroxyisourate hydrolase
MSRISTHVLDVSRGAPASDVLVRLERVSEDGSVSLLSEQRTNDDGRVASLLAGHALREGSYRITFFIAAYFRAHSLPVFYPEAQVMFVVSDAALHHHIPLLLSPFGYSTYRGS